MKPPVCALCGRDFRERWLHDRGGGELVRFADYEPLPPCHVGHPRGAAWFCETHAEAAAALSRSSLGDALRALRARFGEGGWSLPLLPLLLLLVASLGCGLFLGVWWGLAIFGLYLLTGFASAALRAKKRALSADPQQNEG